MPRFKKVVGTYGIVVLHGTCRICWRRARGSPLVLGLGKGENFSRATSARSSLIRGRRLSQDYDICRVTRDKFEISSLLGGASGSK